jgi:hypothetical protein
MNFKFGKLPKKIDTRTLQLKNFLVYRNLPPLPDFCDVDSAFTNFSNGHMYGNDRYGDCVIAGRAHMTLRFEEFEESKLIPITDSEVTTEYFKESGGLDSGLVMLSSLNAWRQSGWTAAGKSYNIHAYAEIDKANHNELKYTVLLLRGAYTGFSVPQSAMDQFNAGQPWTVVANSPIVGGHCVYIKAYNAIGPICVTWGADQQMTWEFWDKYFDEAYAVIDNINTWCDPATDPLNLVELDAQLAEITSSSPNPTPPTPSPCGTGKTAAKIIDIIPWLLHRKGRFYYMNPSTQKKGLIRKLKTFASNFTKAFVSILGGLITLVISAMFQIHSLWQLDIICVGPVWNLCVNNIVKYQDLIARGFMHYSDETGFQDGQFFRMTVGNAYDFFLGMNYLGWCLAVVGTFLIMFGIILFYKEQIKTLKNRKV